MKSLPVHLDESGSITCHHSGVQRNAALHRLEELQPNTIKQLAKSMVLPIVDYASPIQYPLATQEPMQLRLSALCPTDSKTRVW